MAKSASPSFGVLEQVKQLLADNRPEEAHGLLGRVRDTSAPVVNARAVCLLRLGRPQEAARILGPLAYSNGGMMPNLEALLSVRVNYATALLLSGNISGCQGALRDLFREEHPSIDRLRGALAKWRKSQGLWRRLLMAVGVEPYGARVVPDSPPGEL